MKKILYVALVSILILFAAILISFQSYDKKDQTAPEKERYAKYDLKKIKAEINSLVKTKASISEREVINRNTKETIRKNEISIAELKVKINQSGKTYASFRERRIGRLESQNRKLKARMEDYEKSQKDFESFRPEL